MSLNALTGIDRILTRLMSEDLTATGLGLNALTGIDRILTCYTWLHSRLGLRLVLMPLRALIGF